MAKFKLLDKEVDFSKMHYFFPDVAEDVGINASIIYTDIAFWCMQNEVKGKDFMMYSSVKDFANRTPYLSLDQIRRALDKLRENGYITSTKELVNKYTCSDKESVMARMERFGNNAIWFGTDAKPTPIFKEEKENFTKEKEEKENIIYNIYNTKEKESSDVFDLYLHGQIIRQGMMKMWGIDEKTLDYCINEARKYASTSINKTTSKEAQNYVTFQLRKVEHIKGSYEERRNTFFKEVFDIANRLHIDTNIADRFYGYWTQIAVPELKIMKFETEDAWKTENMLRGMNNRIQAKNS